MKTQLKKALIATCFGASLLALGVSAQAATECSLGSTCSLTNDGQTFYTIVPKQGLQYECSVKVPSGSVVFNVSGGSDFTIDSGYGVHRAAPETTIKISGHYKDLNDPYEAGQIKFSKLYGKDATVSCQAIS